MNSVRAVLKGGLSIFQSDGFGAPFVVIRKDGIFARVSRFENMPAMRVCPSLSYLSFLICAPPG